MQPVTVLPLSQVEYAVDDLERSSRFFYDTFGEKEVEERFAETLSNELLEIRHVGFGQVVQQLCRPPLPGLPHHDALQAHGCCVHNLCYVVDNIDNMVSNCREAGFSPLIDFPLDDLWASLIEADNLGGNHHAWIFDTRETLGFQLELAEVPWREEPEPPLMLPAFSENWARLGKTSGARMQAINVVVKDAALALEKLRQLFGFEVEIIQTAQAQASGVIRARAQLAGVELVYLQPRGGELGEFLHQHGPSVHSLVATVEQLPTLVQALHNHPRLADCAPDASAEAFHLQAREELGIDFILLAQESVS